ncbi:type I restriction-modification protein subunit M [Clostridium perfringens]|uniref:type I restriction-modification system subunit M n=1 Tax=Clostridium perfringens TaxID=1502 RepID=UPI0013D4CE59|nr:type I restriction-modification system subunit M [Clostridium perfringens]ELC8405611.1 type I restriction-modification system subunit M [Clostridium perfringens]KAF2785056.1 type I restriction-modification protein subunit M [Clostridium perfringens]
MNKQELANKIWDSANKMRSKIEANEYKDYILGFMFYKFLSEKEMRYLYSADWDKDSIKEYLNEEDPDTVEDVQNHIGYFISYENLFSTWLESGKDFDISNVRDALSAFNRLIDKNYKKLFEGIFDTLETGLSKLGTTAAQQTKAVRDLISIIKDIPMNGEQDYDVLGFIYEDLLKNFASNAGKKAGEFYTPHEVSLLMSEIVAEHLKEREDISILDTTSGSASLLLNIGKSLSKYIDKDSIKYFAQELKQNTYNLTRMNLIMRGILPSNIITRNADTLEEDWPYFDESDPIGTYETLYVDAVVSNPPYSQAWDPTDKENDLRYNRYGLAPKGKADYAFLLHDLYHIKPDGIMNIVLPHGVLFRGGEEGTIRKNLIENNNIDTIIGLPANIFYGTGIPTIIIVLKQKRENTDVLIIDASKGFIKEGKQNKLQASDIRKIVDTVKYRKDIEKYSKKVSREEIRENDYNLNIPRYVDSSETPESYDIYASMFGGIPKSELEALNKYWEAFPSLKNVLFDEISETHLNVKNVNVKEIIRGHEEVKNFYKDYKNALDGFDNKMGIDLIENMEDINIAREENILAEELFNRLYDIKLVDEYKAYQKLADEWEIISQDLETIRIDGKKTLTEVVPNMVLKKKGGKDVEVQEGWIGRIIPFELVKKTILKEESENLNAKEERLQNVISEQTEIFDSFSEEDKDDLAEALNNDNTAFISAGLNKLSKEFIKEHNKDFYDEESLEYKVILTKELSDEEKELKKEIKKLEEELHVLTKETIEKLNEEEVKELLKKKWIEPLTDSFDDIYENIIETLISKIEALEEKYSVTFADVEKEINKVEEELIGFIEQLTGNEADMKGLSEFKKLLGGE